MNLLKLNIQCGVGMRHGNPRLSLSQSGNFLCNCVVPLSSAKLKLRIETWKMGGGYTQFK